MIEIKEAFNYATRLYKPPKKAIIPKPSIWISRNFIDPITNKLMRLQSWQARILDHALQIDEDGYSKYDLVVWSQAKKSGKTTIAGAVGAYAAVNIEAPNEISCVANDQEQSAGRIFAAMMPTLTKLNWSTPVSYKSVIRNPSAFGDNGTNVKAITVNYEKEAGSNQGLSLWSELWAYKSERLSRLWEEMTPPPTRRFSMRWVETYAGYIGESKLLQDLYLSCFKDFEESDLQDRVIKLWDDLPVYEVNEHMLIFWDHKHRMPWQTEKYYESQRDTMRYNAYIRLHENRWVESRDTFITYEDWQQSISHMPKIPQRRAIYALDASKNNDSTALVGCYRQGNKIYTSDIHVWETTPGTEIDFTKVEEKIVELWRKKLIHPPLYYDPYQCVKLAQDLRAKGISCKEYSQGADRVKSDTFLYKLYNEGMIANPNNSILRKHVLAASAKEYEGEKLRIIKPSGEDGGQEAVSQKVDAAIAQSMAAYMAYLKKMGSWGISGD